MSDYIKFPRTFHLPWSEGYTSDDRVLIDTLPFEYSEVVVTEKLDGENTSIYSDGYFHARSLNGNKHASQTKIKQLAAQLKGNIPNGMRIMGENVSALHTVNYDKLDSCFYMFGAAIGDDILSWDDVEFYAAALGLKTVPVLFRGIWSESKIKSCYGAPSFGNEQEGYVVRKTCGFKIDDYCTSVAKFVSGSFKSRLSGSDNWRTGQFKWNKIN